ncbi:hypothetical protein ABE28_011880 [Peribacillus muralis]|uniref:DUF4825 domain-containing protein n=2 Tax=Peribacillus muralis TaxID=264697 RepID=A0A1B3XPF6_9BACI|nr:hypothetical protein ABE28_011880 [Peribacillus muralis]
MELETNEKLDGMILDYTKEEAAMDDEAIHETIIYIATYIFALMKNADWITFNFGVHMQKVTRKE